MAGKSPVRATPEQLRLLEATAGGGDRAEADRARSILLTLKGWTSSRIAEAYGVREDTVRLWRSEFMSGASNLHRPRRPRRRHPPCRQ
jgi:transposase